MGIAQDLLEQAKHLATYEGPHPSQAALRRSVSTAYYALFHLLVEETGQRWKGSAESVTGLERAMNHGQMKNISILFSKSVWLDWHGVEQPVPLELQVVAKAFIELQEDRHTADYDNHEQWSFTEVQSVLNTTMTAFQKWNSIRTDAMAGNYLLAMLLGKKR